MARYNTDVSHYCSVYPRYSVRFEIDSKILFVVKLTCYTVDGSMGQVTNVVLLLIIACLSRLVAIIFSAPIFIIPGLLIGIVGGMMGQLYIKAQVSVKREQSNAKSPVLAEVNGAFDGLASIRAFGAQDMFTRRSIAKINKYSHVSVLLYNLNKWISVRIQVSCWLKGGLMMV
jgi:ABC-type multidrug transport system fused ATPase/permease subunit